MNTTNSPDRFDDNEVTYRIGELSTEFDVTLRTLRFYEDKGLLSPRRIGNTRLYSQSDRGRLKLILFGKRVGMSLVDVKEILDLYDPKGNNSAQINLAIKKSEEQLEALEKQRQETENALVELKDKLSVLRDMKG